MKKEKNNGLLVAILYMCIVNISGFLRFVTFEMRSFNTFDIKAITNPKINDLIYINKNDKGEIISIDYRFNEGYVFLNDSMDRLYEDINNINLSDTFIEGKDDVFFVPSLLVTNNSLLNNFGMKIPVKVRMFKKVDMSFKTKVKEYGINNVLVELYLKQFQKDKEDILSNTFQQNSRMVRIFLIVQIIKG